MSLGTILIIILIFVLIGVSRHGPQPKLGIYAFWYRRPYPDHSDHIGSARKTLTVGKQRLR